MSYTPEKRIAKATARVAKATSVFETAASELDVAASEKLSAAEDYNDQRTNVLGAGQDAYDHFMRLAEQAVIDSEVTAAELAEKRDDAYVAANDTRKQAAKLRSLLEV